MALAAYVYHRRTRADVSPSVDDVLGALRKTLSDGSNKNIKDSTDLDNQIKKFISNSDACVRVCDEILKIVSEHIATLGPWPQVRCKNIITPQQIFLPCHNLQHLWCQLVSGSLTSSGLDRLNAFLDDKRHTGRARCVFCNKSSVRCILTACMHRNQVLGVRLLRPSGDAHWFQPQDVCTSLVTAGSCCHPHCISVLPFMP